MITQIRKYDPMRFGSILVAGTTAHRVGYAGGLFQWLAVVAFVASMFGIGLGAAHGVVDGSDHEHDGAIPELGVPDYIGDPPPLILLPCNPPLPPNPGEACWWVLQETLIQSQHPQTIFKLQDWFVVFTAYYPNGCQTSYCEGYVPPPLAVEFEDEYEVLQSYTVSGSLQLAGKTNAIGKAIAEVNAAVSINGQMHNSETKKFVVKYPTRCVPFCMVLPYKELVKVGNAVVDVADKRVVRTWRLEQSPTGPPFVICDFEETTTTSCQTGDTAQVVAGGGTQKKIEQMMKTCGPCPAVPCDLSDQPNVIEILPPNHPCSSLQVLP